MKKNITILIVSIIALIFLLYLNVKQNKSNIGDESWSERVLEPRIFCIILTTTEHLKTRAKAIFDTWAVKCDNYRFVTKLDYANKEEVSINVDKPFINNLLQPAGFFNESYDKLTDKVYLTIKYLYRKYKTYDWYLKADDDTFIFVDNLRKFLSDKNPLNPITYGYDFKVYVENGYHSGGAGYVLSREAFLRIGLQLNNDYEFCPNTGFEDIDIASCLRNLNVYPAKSIDLENRERFHPFDIATHYDGTYPDYMKNYSSNGVKKVRIYFIYYILPPCKYLEI